MSVELDPIIAQKLEDFRRRRRNLIFLRGVCTAIVTLLGVFSTIAIADYLTQARMPDQLRTVLSYSGYAIVIVAVWRTCVRLMIELPNRRKLARLIEQAAPELREDLLSAVELGREDGMERDSEIFRKLVQQDVSSRVKSLDMTSTLPLTRLRRWLQATAGLIALTLILLYNPDFGGKFQRAIGRALLPGANIAAVTDIEVTILTPGEEIKVTPKSEPLRFLVAVSGKNKEEVFDRVEFETRVAKKKRKPIAMSARNEDKFSLDYNVDREKFEYRILVDDSPVTMNIGSKTAQWIEMDVASRPFVTSFTKTYRFPEYTKLEPLTVTEDRGDLTGWEGTEVELVLHTNQPTTGGILALDLTGPGASELEFKPSEDGLQLSASLALRNPGTYRAVEVESAQTGWKSKPSQAFEIIVQLDEAPAIRVVSPEEKSLLVASDDILPLTIAARDDLALEKIEYHVQVNKRGWKKFPVPGLGANVDKKELMLQFDLDLIDLKLRPNDQAILKLVAFDRKGASGESDPLQLSIISRDLDLSAIQTLKLKSLVFQGIAKLATSADSRAKATMELYNSSLQGKDVPLSPAVAEELRALSGSLAEESELLLGQTLTALAAMPRGTDSFEVAFVARAVNLITHLRAGEALSRAETAIATDNPSIRRDVIQEFRAKIESDRGLTGNLRNITQKLLAYQVRAVSVTYLRQLLKNQGELEELLEGDYHYKSVVRRQEVALNHWRTIEKVLKLSSSTYSHYFRNVSREENSLRQALDRNETKQGRSALARSVKSWNDRVRQVHDTANNRLRGTARSSRSGRENFLWQVRESWYQLNNFAGLVGAVESNPDHASWESTKGKWVERDTLNEIHGAALVSGVQGRASLEESRKDADSPFVKDLGQTGRALRRLGMQFQSQGESGDEAVPMADRFKELTNLFRLLETYHEAIEALGLASTFANKEKWEMVKSDNRAERAIHWGASAAPWRILAGRVAGIPSEQMQGATQARSEAAQILRDLPKQPYAKAIDEEMDRRVEDLGRAPRSTAKEVELVQADLRRVIKLLSPAVKAAREKLSQLAPSLPELARQLAKKAREAKAQSEAIAEKPDDEAAQVRREATELQREQRVLGGEITLFNAALRQEANVQNILDEEGREIARDADAAAALVQDRQNASENALAQVLQATDRGSQNENLEKASEKQGELAEALEAIADHFERVDKGEEVSETREDLRQVEKDLGIKEQVDEQFAQAERLAELAKLSAQELLEELEKELEENKPMQQELSEIAEDTVEEAQEALEEAAQEEEEIAENLENTDKEKMDEKKQLARELDRLALDVKRLADREVRQASHLARQASAGESFEELTESREDLLQLAEEAREAAKPEETASELAEAAQDLVEPLLQESADLADAAESAEEVSKLHPEAAAKQAEERKTIAEETSSQAEQAQEQAEVAQQQAETAEQKANDAVRDAVEAAQDAAFAEQQAEQAAEQASRKPGDQTAQNEASQASENAEQAREEAQDAQQAAQQAQQAANELAEKSEAATEVAEQAQAKAEQAEQEAEFAEQRAERKPSQFASAQRNASRAQEQSESASKKAEKLSRQAEELAEKLEELGGDSSPDSESLAQAQKQQEEVGEEVFDVAQDIARAARHEDRLGNEEAAEALSEIAENTQQAAEQEVAEAGQELQNEQLAQQLGELAEEGQELAQSQEAQQAARQNVQAQQAQESLQEAGQEAQEAADGQPDFQEIGDAAEEFAQETQAAAEEFAQAAEQGQQQAEQAQQQAQQAQQQAQQAQQQAQQAQQQAQQAQQQAQQAQQQASAQPENTQAQQAAQEAGQHAEQAQQAAQEAAQQAQQAQQAAQEAGQEAQEAGQQAQAGQETAQEAAELAEAAESFAEAFPSEPAFAEAGGEESGEGEPSQESGFGEALASAEQALGEQAEALASLGEQSGEGQQPGEPPSGEGQQPGEGQPESGQGEPSEGQGEAQGQPSEGQSEPGQGEPSEGQGEGQGQPSEGQPSESQSGEGQGQGEPSQSGESPPPGQGSPSPSSSEAALTNPETAEALAQTLDSLDQALNPAANPFGQESVPSEGGIPSDTPLSEAAQAAQLGQGQPSEGQPGEGPLGQGQPSQGQPSESSQSQSAQAQAQALAEAAQALAQATMVQASSMAQSRMQSQNAMTQGMQPNSGEGAAVDAAPVTVFEELPAPDLENKAEFEWSRLPPKLAKDLMDGRREAVSGEYRNRVEAYFRAMAEKSRKKK